MYQPLPLEGYEFAGQYYPWPGLDHLSAHSLGRSAGRIAIVGLSQAGKKTLVNSLWGWPALKGSQPTETVRKLGLFTLITPPTDTTDETNIIYHLESADLVIYLIDGLAGPKADDIHWLARLRVLPGTLLIVLNKSDQLNGSMSPPRLEKLQDMFARPVIKLTASDQRVVHDQFLPVVLKACPQLAIPLATEITGLRWQISRQLIRDAAVKSSTLSLENSATIDLPALLDLQRRLVRQIAHIYGYGELDDPNPAQWPRLAQQMVNTYAPRVLALLGPRGKQVVMAALAFGGTWLLGFRTQAKYDVHVPIHRLTRLLSRNGQHDSAHAE